MHRTVISALIIAIASGSAIAGPAADKAKAHFAAIADADVAQSADMTFFVTSVGSGKGGDFGGLDGADAHCQRLAEAAGAGRTEKPNKHDMLTGSRPDGTAFAGAFFPDMTCGN